MWTGTDWTVVGAQAAGVGTVLFGVYKWINKHFPKEVQAVEKDVPSGIKTIAEDAIYLVENLAKSPLFAGIAAEGKVEAHHVLDKLAQTTAVSEAKTVLLGVGKVYDKLSDQEKVKAEVTLRLVLSGLGISMTDAQIQDVFTEAQKAIESLQSTPMFKASFEEVPAQA